MSVAITLRMPRESLEIANCEDCPCFRDPDPHPCQCTLDDDVDVHGGGPVPDDCPWLDFRVEVHP